MLSSPVFRYAKPEIADIYALLANNNVAITDTPFIDQHVMSVMNRCLFDVISVDEGHTLNRAEGFLPDYWFEGTTLKVRKPGNYLLRVYGLLSPFESNLIPVGRRMVKGQGGGFNSSVPFWPQIMSQPEFGLARVSNDGQSVAYVSQGVTGQASFSYRLVNAYGQVSEPACVRVTTI